MILVAMAVCFAVSACGGSEEKAPKAVNYPYEGGGGKSFKIPVPKGYDWEVSQSWGKHCKTCDERYPSDEVSYCESSHMEKSCEFGWDFNLPGNADSGKPVLATANGHVQEVSSGENGGWGNMVILNHGDDLCSRHSHLLENSIKVEEGQQICQGMAIAEIGDSGNSSGPHLHFQFENCQTGSPIEIGFNDGNGIPLCTRGEDRYDSDGNYIALKLTNSLRENCEEEEVFGGEELPSSGWVSASCGALSGCPMITNCGREQNHQFKDGSEMEARVKKAAMYLYGECAVDGKSDGEFHSRDTLTRAEALKVPMYLFGLTANCGSDEPFADVDTDDWFFGVVACGVKYGLLEHASNFDPDSEVTFAQAAKFVVMAAERASVIDIQSPSQSHFPGIGKDHWAYEYVETLAFYGGLLKSPDEYSSGQTMERGEYALMVASMSPCFCENVSCEQGCRCNQEMFACTDSSDDPGIGGENSNSEGVEENNLEWEDVLEINCHVDPSHTECGETGTFLYIKCRLDNKSEVDLSLNDLVLTLVPDYEECEVIDSNLQTGVGVQSVEAGESKDLNGHYEILCSSLNMEELEVSFDLKERISGNVTWSYEVVNTYIEIAGLDLSACNPENTGENGDCTPLNCLDAGRNCGPIDDGCGSTLSCGTCELPMVCDGGLCRPCEQESCWENWECNPENPYSVHVTSNEGGSAEILTADGAHSSFQITEHMNWSNGSFIPCDGLPAAILVTSGPHGANVGIRPITYPPAAFYFNYNGAITLNPPGQPSDLATFYGYNEAFTNLLIIIPFVN